MSISLLCNPGWMCVKFRNAVPSLLLIFASFFHLSIPFAAGATGKQSEMTRASIVISLFP